MDARHTHEDGRKARPATWAALAATAVLLSVLPVVAQAAERATHVALVIGNSKYEHVSFLPNARDDAEAVGVAFENLGYAVTRLMNKDRHVLHDGLISFKKAARGKEVAVVFYAGHGIGVGGSNFLVPVDAELGFADDVEDQTIPLTRLMSAVGNTQHLGVVILDACRNNPFVKSMEGDTRSIERGLAQVEPTGRTMVAYAAKDGQVALDGDGDHSPYTEALLKYLREAPGLPVRKLFGTVRDAVEADTEKRFGRDRKQVPWTYHDLGGSDYYLVASAAAAIPTPKDTETAGGGTKPGGSVQPPKQQAEGILLPDGLTLADWSLLAEDRLKAGDHARLLEEAGAHLREYGPVESVEAIREQAVSGLIEQVRVTTREDAPGALERIVRIEAEAGERPELLHLKARAHGLLGDHAAEEAAYLQWLRSVPQSHPERRNVLSALVRVREKAKQMDKIGKPPLVVAGDDAVEEEPPAEVKQMDKLGKPPLVVAGGDAVEEEPPAVAAPSPAEVEEGLDLSQEVSRLVQMGLAAAGFDPGPADGKIGRRTRGALRAWQESRELEGTGYLTKDQSSELVAMGREEAERRAREEEVRRAEAEREAQEHEAAQLRRFTELLGRPFSAEFKTEAEGWTDLHYAALLDLPGVVAALCDAGMDPDTRLKDEGWGSDFSEDLIQTLAALGHEDFGYTAIHSQTPLMIAAGADARDAAAGLAACGADVNAKASPSGRTALHSTGFENFLDVAKLLIDRGADVNAADSDDETPLSNAARANSLDVAKLLIDRGADVNAADSDGETPLHGAARANSLDVAKLLIDRGAVVNAADSDGETPLSDAARANSLDVAKLLIDRSADVNTARSDGWTPLHGALSNKDHDMALRNEAHDMAKLLIERGADVNATYSHYLLEGGQETPLELAVQHDSLDLAKLLIDRGAEVNATGYNGRTPLYTAVRLYRRNSLDVAKLLIARGADVNAKDEYGKTPLHFALYEKDHEMAKLLIDRGADVNAKDNAMGNLDDVIKDAFGGPMYTASTPLHHAAEENYHEMAKLLIDRGADVNATNDYIGTPLQVAAWRDSLDVAKLLIESGVDVNATLYATPLFIAALSDSLDVAKLLIESDANVNTKSNSGETPLDIATKKGHGEMYAMLLRNGGRCAKQC